MANSKPSVAEPWAGGLGGRHAIRANHHPRGEMQVSRAAFAVIASAWTGASSLHLLPMDSASYLFYVHRGLCSDGVLRVRAGRGSLWAAGRCEGGGVEGLYGQRRGEVDEVMTARLLGAGWPRTVHG